MRLVLCVLLTMLLTSSTFAAQRTLTRSEAQAIGLTADKRGFLPAMVCPLLTQQRHWLCTAAMVSMPVSAPTKVLV